MTENVVKWESTLETTLSGEHKLETSRLNMGLPASCYTSYREEGHTAVRVSFVK